MKTALITGASDGIGEQAATALAEQGWQVAVIGRNKERTAAVAKRLHAPYYLADFAKLGEVKALGLQLKRDFPRIDVLANNAGGMFKKQPLTEDGYEMSFQVNHLAHFLLTKILLTNLIESKAKVISTSSVAHKTIGLLFKLDDVKNPKHFSQHLAYGNAKLANILFTRELHRRYHAQGISAAAFHPGVVATSFAKDTTSFMRVLYHTSLRRAPGVITAQDGARTLIWLAQNAPGLTWQAGGYYAKEAPARCTRKAKNAALAQGLWEMSETLVAPFLDEERHPS
ncbi:MAG: SDR family NAD(P)-dependent oxidoreductase [Clostridiales bacterium]|nr:SDR family NAD(P)-dependent oxidoreductase [Clostridiales bacterium]